MLLLRSIQKLSNCLRQRPLTGRLALKCLPDFRFKIQVTPIGDFHIRLRRNRSFWLREPLTENRQLLEANIKAGGLQGQVQIVPSALSDNDGEEDLQVDDMMSGSAVLDRVTAGEPCQGRKQYGMPSLTERVAVARLDHLV